MTRRATPAVLGLLGLVLATTVADAGWGRRRARGTPHTHATTRDDRTGAWREDRIDHEGYQGYNLGAFDIPEVRARRGDGAPSGFVLLRFPLHWRRSNP